MELTGIFVDSCNNGEEKQDILCLRKNVNFSNVAVGELMKTWKVVIAVQIWNTLESQIKQEHNCNQRNKNRINPLHKCL